MKEEKRLIGKKIETATIIGHSKGCDSENVLVLGMSDGSKFSITGGYGGYTGNSCDEYVEVISVSMDSKAPRRLRGNKGQNTNH